MRGSTSSAKVRSAMRSSRAPRATASRTRLRSRPLRRRSGAARRRRHLRAALALRIVPERDPRSDGGGAAGGRVWRRRHPRAGRRWANRMVGAGRRRRSARQPRHAPDGARRRRRAARLPPRDADAVARFSFERMVAAFDDLYLTELARRGVVPRRPFRTGGLLTCAALLESCRSTGSIEHAASRALRMRDVITHRGPDEAGLHCDAHAGARPSPPEHRRSRRRASSRCRTRTARVWVVVQRRDLQPRRRSARELEARGHVYRTSSDTETIVHAYEQWGDALRRALPRHVRVRDLGRAAAPAAAGARSPRHQAALLGDARRTRCCSDRRSRRSSRAASSSRARTSARCPRCSSTRYTSGEETMFKGIHKLLPGHCWSSRAARSRRRQYWDVPRATSRPERRRGSSDADAVARFRELLEESVRCG